MKYPAARNALELVCRGGCDAVASFGISKDDFRLVTGNGIWLASDRERVRRVLENLLFGSMDLMGLQRITAPAEYIAAVLVVFVAPVNLMPACRFFEHSRPADDLALGPQSQQTEMVTAHQLFALCVDLVDPAAIPAAAAAFEKRVGLAIEHAKRDGDTEAAPTK